jgi:thioredoxin-related protein
MSRITKIALLTAFFTSTIAWAQVAFVPTNFSENLQSAKAEGKYLFVDAYTDWCGWCKVMDKETFSDSVVGQFMDTRFVSTKINMEEGFGIDLAMKYRVSSYPHYLIFSDDGALLAKLGGFMKPEPFIDAITEIIENKAFLPPSPDPMNFTEGYPEFLRNSYKKNKERTNPTGEEVEAFLRSREDLTDEVSWTVISRFVGGGEFAAKTIENREILIQKYGEKEVMDKLSSFVFNDVKMAIKNKDEAMLDAILDKTPLILGDASATYNLRYRLYFYQMTENWDAYATVAQSIAVNDEMNDAGTLNQMAWNIFENNAGAESVKMAISWMEGVVEESPEYAYLDTYAALLYKANRKDDALRYAEKALEAGKTSGANTTDTQELIEQIKAL